MNKTNLPESIYARLKNVAKKRKRPVQEILKYYAMERFLYRLSISSHQNFFYLKGGLMLMIWTPRNHRATVDIDLLTKTKNSISNLKKILQEVCTIDCPPDGILLDLNSLLIEKSQLNMEYSGISAAFTARLFTAKLPLRIDFGFSDMILPKPAEIIYPTLLNLPPPKLKGYTPETSIAEKLESIIKLGQANTRMKDFYDLWILTREIELNRDRLFEIVRQVCQNRNTSINSFPEAFLETYYEDPQKNEKWRAFLKNITSEDISLERVILDLKAFFEDIFLNKNALVNK